MPEYTGFARRKLVRDAGPLALPRAAYVELGVTTPFSFLRGASDAIELVLTALELGMDAIGVADRDTLAGVVRMHSAAKGAGLRPLIGCRLDLADDWSRHERPSTSLGTNGSYLPSPTPFVSSEVETRTLSLLAYPLNREGYGRLSRVLSLGKMRSAKGACDLTLGEVGAHSEGIAFIAMPGEDVDAFERALPGLVAALPGMGHVAASHLYRGDDLARIERIDRMAKRHGLSLLATNDVHYHAPHKRPLQDVMSCIREKVTLATAGYLLNANAERHLKSPAAMARLFERWPHAIENTRKFADAIDFSLDELQYEYPRESVPEGRSPQAQIEHLTWVGASKRWPEGVPPTIV